MLVWSLLLPRNAQAQVKPSRRILVLHEVGPWYPVIRLIDAGIRTGLENSPYKIDFYYEYLDALLFPDPASQKEIRDSFVRKYRNRIPDVIITVGPAPLSFMTEAHSRFFPGVPVVFCIPNGLLQSSGASHALDPDFTGVETDFAAAQTLEAALRLQPDLKHVMVVGGVAEYDRQRMAIVKRQLGAYDKRLDISYLADLAMPALLAQLRNLPEHSAVLMTAIGKDAAGTQFTSDETGPLVSAAANAPVYSLSDLYIGHGEVGGDLAELSKQGKAVAALTLRILGGEKPQSIPPVKGVVTFLYDWLALRRWGLNEKNLPPGSVLINRQPSLWETYRRYIVPAILLLLGQGLVIAALLWQKTKRKRAEVDLVWRLEFESLIAHFSSTFIGLPETEVDGNVERNVARFGEFLKLDRISLFEISSDQAELVCAFSWQAEGIEADQSPVNTTSLPWWSSRLLRGEVALVSGPEDLPQAAFAELEYFRRAGIISAGSVPLKVSGRVTGAISFVTTKRRISWTPDLTSQLQLVGEILWNALQRKRALAVLRESEERFRLVANTAPVMIWMSGPDMQRTFFNQCWLAFTGRPISSELGLGWRSSIHPDNLQSYLDGYAARFREREPFRVEYRLRRQDGEYRWILDQAIPRFHSDGSFAGYIGCGVDVTERKRAEEAISTVSRKLIEAHEQERALLARELHDDFNQRLALLSVGLQSLREQLPSSAARARHSIDEVCEDLCELSTDIHDLSHRLHSSKLDLLGLVAASTSTCKELADKQGLDIGFRSEDVPKNLPKEVSLCLFRVLQEALRNATKHSGARQLEVLLKGSEDEITMTVCDSGKGFDTENAINGKGLGLISMAERLRLVHGQLLIESKPRFGTTIRARVPLQPKAVAATAGKDS